MPKSQLIDPNSLRKPSMLTFQPISVNQYNKTIQEERANFTDDQLKSILHDMVLIREFETMLNLIKTKGEYQGVPYNHPGPAHLSIGQESAAVGMAFTLSVDAFIFGSHRRHGAIPAKGMSAIHQSDDAYLKTVMENGCDGTRRRIVSKGCKGTSKERARRFLVY